MSEKDQGASTAESEYAKMSADIEKAVAMAVEGDNTVKDLAEDPVVPVPAKKGTEEPFNVGDAEIERAVRNGFSVEDARKFTDKSMFDRVMEAVEKAKTPAAPKTTSGDDGENDGGGAENPPDDDIPELTEDEGFDPKLVSAFRKMGSMIKNLKSENARLRKAGESASAESFFDKQFGSLDESVRSRVDETGKAKLMQKFNVLEAGYKAAKADVSREDVFREAAELALGDVMRKADEEGRSSRAAARRSLMLAPPGGEPGSRGKPKSEDDVDREVARLVSEKFNI